MRGKFAARAVRCASRRGASASNELRGLWASSPLQQSAPAMSPKPSPASSIHLEHSGSAHEVRKRFGGRSGSSSPCSGWDALVPEAAGPAVTCLSPSAGLALAHGGMNLVSPIPSRLTPPGFPFNIIHSPASSQFGNGGSTHLSSRCHCCCFSATTTTAKNLAPSSQLPRSFPMCHTRPFSSGSTHSVSSAPLPSANGSTSSAASSARLVPPGGFLPLNDLQDKPGSRKQKTRLGRGIGSGKGKTAGRGHKGQKARSGRRPRIGFEGGQTPLRLTLPKRGFHNPFSLEFQEVNLDTISRKIQEGRIDPKQLITMKTLKDAGAVGKAMRDGVKLLGRGAHRFAVPVHIEVSRVSQQAKQAIEAAGGSVTRVHYNKLGLRALYMPEWFEKKGRLLPRAARPPPRLLGQVDAIGRLPAPTTLPSPPEATAT